MTVYMGIDTSCYTTSIALAGDDGQIVLDERMSLQVPGSKKGLRQSQALFLHVKNLIEFFGRRHPLSENFKKPGAICVSVKPIPVDGSYMPVFLAGQLAAFAGGGISDVPVYTATHQEGHLAAALIENIMPDRFIAFHVSGGTTEIMKVKQRMQEVGYEIEPIGRTKDITAGQLIDRVAQRMDFPFPGGKYIEDSAEKRTQDPVFKISVSGTDMNFSGLEAQALRAVDDNRWTKSDICYGILTSIALTLYQVLSNAVKLTGIKEVLLFGGVISNNLIRTFLSSKIENIKFAKKEYSSDNAAGLALIAAEKRRGKIEC